MRIAISASTMSIFFVTLTPLYVAVNSLRHAFPPAINFIPLQVPSESGHERVNPCTFLSIKSPYWL